MKTTTKFILFFLSSYILFSCSSYDDDELWSEVKKIKTDISTLKEQTNSLQSAIDAVKAGKTITQVTQLTDKEGYKITFNDGNTIEILNGSDAPVLGIEEADGTYFWTITSDGEKTFLTDADGNKMPVSGKDGKTPKIGIDAEGFWTVDNVRIKDSNENEVKALGDSFFKDVQQTNDTVTFVLADDTNIKIPKAVGAYLRFKTDNDLAVFVFNKGDRKKLEIEYSNIHSISILKKPEEWQANLHLPNKYVELTAPENASYGIKEIIVRGLDKNGMVFQAIAKISVAGSGFSNPLGVFILNEGNMSTENGSLIYITPDGEVLDRAYFNTNGSELGNVTQDIFIKDNKIYIISQNGQKNPIGVEFQNDGMLVVANSETLKREATYNEELKDLSWPSHVAVLNEENIFIRDNKGIYHFNSKTKELTFVAGTDGADKNTMAVIGNKVFASKGTEIVVLTENSNSVANKIDMVDKITGVLKSKDGNIWVSTVGEPNKIAKVNSETYEIIKENEITEGGLGRGWGATPGITAKGDTIYYSNATTKIYRHIFSTAETSFMVDAKEMVDNANIVYNNIAVHPITGKVYINTLSGWGWGFLTNNISEFDFSTGTPVLSNNYTNYTHFPAGIFFPANYK